MSNSNQKGIVEFQVGMQHPVKQGEKETAVCNYYKKVDISKFFCVFPLNNNRAQCWNSLRWICLACVTGRCLSAWDYI